MPRLDWIGRKAVENHHNEVPFRLLKCDPELSVGDPDSGNLLIEGDNLEALKALLPYYIGEVKCIYIDPPYNTGNENWAYNDNVNSPEISKWLGQTVGKEAEDLSRHDKWLCMMYPRLRLLHRFLKEDGAIFVSIDDNEVNHLRDILDEIFGRRNFITTVIWQKVYSPKNSARHFSEDHDYIVVYAKNADIWRPNLISRSAKQDKAYKNPDSDPRGLWKTSDLSARNPYSLGTYSITCPSGRVIDAPPKGAYWRYSKDKFEELDKDNRIWWGKSGDSIPQIKRFLSEVKQGIVPQTLWKYEDVGHTQEAKQELVSTVEFADSASVFITPKPIRLLKRILEVASDEDSIIMDSFAGSGTTGVASLVMNAETKSRRKFILIEIDKAIAVDTTSKRLKAVVKGYTATKTGGKSEEIAGTGGGFKYCKLGSPLFNSEGNIQGEVTYKDLAQHVFFVETGKPLLIDSDFTPPLIGKSENLAVYLLYNGVLNDKAPNGGNVLTRSVLETLPSHNGLKVIFGTSCRIGKDYLKRKRITFKQIPYEIKDY